MNGMDLGVQMIQFWAVMVANRVGYQLVAAII
jgi:hypothetical protein